MVESWGGFRTLLSTSGTFGRPLGDFGEHSDIVENDIAKISRRLQIFVLQGLSGM